MCVVVERWRWPVSRLLNCSAMPLMLLTSSMMRLTSPTSSLPGSVASTNSRVAAAHEDVDAELKLEIHDVLADAGLRGGAAPWRPRSGSASQPNCARQ